MKRRSVVLLALFTVLALAVPAGAVADLRPSTAPPSVSAPADKAPGAGAAPADLPFGGDGNGNRIADDLDARLAGAAADERFPVVVMLGTGATGEVLAELRLAAGDFQPTATWEYALSGFAAHLTRGQIEALARSERETRVDADREVRALLSTATSWTGVQQARADFGVDGDRDGNPSSYSATDVVVAILDTGIDAAHVDLDGGKVIGWRDEINGRTTAYDDHGHGTHVSSIATGTGEGNSAYRGVAPGAALVGIKVLDANGSGTTTGIINGINWMIANKSTYGIRVANMSLGASGCFDGTDSLAVAVNNAVANAISMAVAAGNEGPGTCTVGTPGVARDAITVGALYDPGEKGWVLAEFSSRGPTADGRIKPDIATPGRYITAAQANSGSGYVTYSGTSMATPFLAGVVALMLDANYGLTDSGIKSILYSSGNLKDFGPAGKDSDFGYGINLSYNAIKQAGGFTGSFSDGIGFGYGSGYLSGKGDTDWWQFTVTDATKPIGITFIMSNWAFSKDFDIYLYNPSGTLVASSLGTTRQEQILYQPSVTGTYQLRVYSYRGSGNYWFNSSYK